MRITDDRYSQHRRGLDLAWRMIRHEACMRTISRWTQLSGHRIRALHKSYAADREGKIAKRHRGMSPYKLETILHSPQLRCEAAMFAGLCRSIRVLPQGKLADVDRTLPNLSRGELLCEAYEWFRYDVPDAKLTIEHALLVIAEVARGDVIELGTCEVCRGVMLIDRLSLLKQECIFCATDVDAIQIKLDPSSVYVRGGDGEHAQALQLKMVADEAMRDFPLANAQSPIDASLSRVSSERFRPASIDTTCSGDGRRS